MAEIKTTATAVSVDDFLDAVENPERRADGRTLCVLLERLTGEPPRMWGPSIIGFGSYDYRYDSGHGGTAARMGFSPRAKELVLYFSGLDPYRDQLARLGKVRTAKCCLYIKRLSDVDMAVLKEMLRTDLAFIDEKYPRG